jgi:hypothetical protein
MSTTLPGYVQTPFGGWVADDGSGPYFFDSGGAAPAYIPLASGFWVKPDGSGPYSYDAVTGVATPAIGVFRSM